MTTSSDLATFSHFLTSPRIPPEMILKTIQFIPFGNGKVIASLRKSNPRLRALFDNYEHSITRSFIAKELRHAQTDFPCDGPPDLSWLAQCVQKYDVVDDVMDALSSKNNCFSVEQHNLALVNTGLFLLYHLSTFPCTATKITYLKSLPRDPLLAIYLALHHATLSARYHGSGWIHQRTYGRFMDANQLSLRNELEFCFAEAALVHGPSFIGDTLLRHGSSDAEVTLLNFYHDHALRDWNWPCWGSGKGEFEPPRTQGPAREPWSLGRTLFTTMLERVAECMGCEIEHVRARMEQETDVETHSLAYLDLEGKAQLMRGLDLE
ncbi:hypothetical protein IQ07DRAFT_644061 [Pyrenochaeta sp. DS3sAY3a]|nr:hypothetical protein IQ07DRAFT_644061 [Pyrenochaeta sp. DS3sAY3a]